MASGHTTAVLDFGAHPGSNEATVAVTGLTGVSNTTRAEAYFMAVDSTTDHPATDVRYAPTFIGLTANCGSFSGGRVTVYGRSHHKMTGQWPIRVVYSD
jgi:hypothetical protein